MLTSTVRRVPNYTAESVNQQIQRGLEQRIEYYAANPQQIPERLAELDREWDVERMLETGASSLSLFGILMSVARGRKWLVLPLAVQSFFLQHALQGWCPPLPVLRRLGFRTEAEIDKERYALKALRGDFKKVTKENGRPVSQKVMDAVNG